jgi:hypothetical protein
MVWLPPAFATGGTFTVNVNDAVVCCWEVSALWQRVEGVRNALFQSADRSPLAGKKFFGNGLLRARQALDVPFDPMLPRAPFAEVSFPWLRLLGGLEAAAPTSALGGRQRMYEIEALQLYMSTPRLHALTGGADPHRDQLDRRTARKLIEELGQHRGASRALRTHAQSTVGSSAGKTESSLPAASTGAVSSYELVSRFFRGGSGLESAGGSERRLSDALTEISRAARKQISNARRRSELMADLVQAMRELRAEADGINQRLMTSPQHRLASILQTVLSERLEGRPVEAGLEFAFDGDDVRTVMEEVMHRAANVSKHPAMRPESAEPDPLPKRFRMALVGDFGTGLYGAPITAATIAADPGRFDLLLHLGDVYYSGEPQEVKKRLQDIWPWRPEAINRTLNGNHDMYSGGYGYFDHALPAFGQKSSYFAMQNDYWTLLFLDTAYKDNNLGDKQLKWIGKVVDQADDRKLVLFSHHPLFSNFKKQGKKLASKLHDLLESKRITAWYWGHEHHCVVYEPHPEFGLRTRCLGNGGMPAKRKDLKDYAVVREVEGMQWRRIEADLTPAGIILDGPNPDISESPNDYLPHAFGTIELNGRRLEERIFSPRGKLLYLGEIE